MNEVYVRKDELNSWISKYFMKDLISIDDLICCIEDLDDEVDDLKTKINELENDIEDNFKPVSKAEQYEISDSDFI